MATAQLARQELLIGGTWAASGSGREFQTTDPYTGEASGAAAAATPKDATAAVEAAHAAFAEWGTSAPGHRRAVLTKAAEIMEQKTGEIAAAMTEETGATAGWGGFNVHLATSMLREAAAQTYALIGDVIPSDVPGKLAMGVRQPAGVVVSLAPWNAPVILSTRALAMPLAFGNTVVLKASEQCPRTHGLVVQCLAEAGLPPGAVNLITNDPADAAEIVETLIAHPRTRRVNFTGSTRVGRIIAETAGRHLKRVLLELGGKAPLVILRDADLERAVKAANFGAFMFQGQVCMSTERIVVDRAVADDFTERLTARARSLKVGDPRDPSTQLGPLVNRAALERVAGLVEDARSHGARVLTGGEQQGPCYPPTVIAGVTPEMRVYSEESFGPLASIIPVDGVEEAVRVANDTTYGLSAAVFSGDVPTGLEIARRIESGICHVNDSTVHDEAQMPFGGVKDSGWGRFGGRAALEEFTELRWITVQELPREYPI